jgi:Protein of unknown function (DUF2442)
MRPRVVAVEIVLPYGLLLTFADRSVGMVDARAWVEAGEGIFTELRDPELFAQVRVDPDAETIVWPNDADVDPDTLYEEAHRIV